VLVGLLATMLSTSWTVVSCLSAHLTQYLTPGIALSLPGEISPPQSLQIVLLIVIRHSLQISSEC